MKCVICKSGKTYPGLTTVVLNRDDLAVVIKKVPADICDNCGEYYLSGEVTQKLLEKAEEAVRKGVEVEICRYAA